MLKEIKPGRRYFIINIDEPYAKAIYEILKYGQMVKDEWPEGDIHFEEWKELTFEKQLKSLDYRELRGDSESTGGKP